MKKYDYDIPIGINKASSIGLILGLVPKGSAVLEFGCSYGYMTKFMKEQLNCNMSVVEIDPEAYREARQYAEDGICCDIEKLEWAEYFKKCSFDVIIFADVFEHLQNPSKTLKNTKDLLKEDGRLIFSVPNIAHNDVISNLYDNRFPYTSLGLLDDTHIHFFTYHSLRPFADSGGYAIVEEQYAYRPPFSTEQAEFIPKSRREFLGGLLANHACGDVYQFVCQLQKREYVEQNRISKKSTIEKLLEDEIESTVFFDYGKGFLPKNAQTMIQPFQENRIYDYHLTIPTGARAIRFDPIERDKCIVQFFLLKTDDPRKALDIVGSNGIYCCGVFFFDTLDPQIYIDFKGEAISQLDITVSMIRKKEYPWCEFADLLKSSEEAFQNAFDSKEKQIASISDGKQKIEEKLSSCKQTLGQTRQELEQIRKKLEENEQRLSSCQKEFKSLQEEHQKILNSKWWKFTAPLRKLMREKIKESWE